MDARKRIMDYIDGKMWMVWVGLGGLVLSIATIAIVVGVFLIFPSFYFLLRGVCTELPRHANAKRCLDNLQAKNLLIQAATELDNPQQVVCKNQACLTQNFFFGRGVAIAYGDIKWTYKERRTYMYFIPIAENMYVCDIKGSRMVAISKSGRDKADEIKNTLIKIYEKNPQVLLGFGADRQKAYRQMVRDAKNAAK